jgi:hypothetical protein
MTVHPTGLYPGPHLDNGSPTWFCVFEHVPDDYQWRPDVRSAWVGIGASTTVASDRWVQCRREPPKATDAVHIGEPGFEGQLTYRQVHDTIGNVLGSPNKDTDRIAISIWHLLTQAR